MRDQQSLDGLDIGRPAEERRQARRNVGTDPFGFRHSFANRWRKVGGLHASCRCAACHRLHRQFEAIAPPGIVASALGPSSLRNAEICTCRLFSSTTRPGHTRVRSSFLVTRWPARATRATRRSNARAPSATGLPSARRRCSAGSRKKRPKRQADACDGGGRRGHGGEQIPPGSLSRPGVVRGARSFQRRLRAASGLKAPFRRTLASSSTPTPQGDRHAIQPNRPRSRRCRLDRPRGPRPHGRKLVRRPRRQPVATHGRRAHRRVRDGIEVQRLPSITVTARRSDVDAR